MSIQQPIRQVGTPRSQSSTRPLGVAPETVALDLAGEGATHRGWCGGGDLQGNRDVETTADLVVRVPVAAGQLCPVQQQVFFYEAAQFVDVLGREVLLSPGDGVDVARTTGGVVEGLGDFLKSIVEITNGQQGLPASRKPR